MRCDRRRGRALLRWWMHVAIGSATLVALPVVVAPRAARADDDADLRTIRDAFVAEQWETVIFLGERILGRGANAEVAAFVAEARAQ